MGAPTSTRRYSSAARTAQARAEVIRKLRQALDWGTLVPLRLKARTVADGVLDGAHRSPRRGSGVEFGGHRDYVPGDDLRWLDRHALMRHGRHLVRKFETETDRTLSLVADASASMAYRSDRAPGSKLAYAALLAAALARVALASGDPVALSWLGGRACRPVPGMRGREAFDRIVGALEDAAPGADLSRDPAAFERCTTLVGRQARSGSVIVWLSDLLDLPPGATEHMGALATRGRTLVVARILDPAESSFPFDGPVRLRASEGETVVETDAEAAREGYLAALEAVADSITDVLVPRGSQLVRAVTSDDPLNVVRAILSAAGGQVP